MAPPGSGYVMTMSLDGVIRGSQVVLTEGAVIERLRRDPTVTLDPHVLHAGLIYQPDGWAAVARIYRQYFEIGKACGLPMVVGTPTWRANPERLHAAGLEDHPDVNGDAVRFLAGIRKDLGDYASQVLIGGLTGCRGDAYDPEQALSSKDAAEFHRSQLRALADAGADFLMAATIPAVSEALGITRAAAECSVPFLLSFVIRPTGTVLDGTPLHEAVHRIDAETSPRPLAYLVNCVHPSGFAAALEAETKAAAGLCSRVIGLQGNASRLDPAELDESAELDLSETPEAFAELMMDVCDRFGLRVLGGCCGTDDRHIRGIAERVVALDRG